MKHRAPHVFAGHKGNILQLLRGRLPQEADRIIRCRGGGEGKGFVFAHRWPIMFGIVGAVASGPAIAQDFTQGKTPAQLFASDCGACHKAPQGLAKSDARSVSSFLREHYTTKPEMADALAAYLLASGGRASASSDTGRNADGLRPRAAIPLADEANLPEASEGSKPSVKLRGAASGDTGKPPDSRRRSASTTGDAPKSTEERDGSKPQARVVPDPRRDADEDTATDTQRPKPRTAGREGAPPVPPAPTGKLNAYARSGSSEKDKTTDSADARLSKLRGYANSGEPAPAVISAPPKAVSSPPPAEPEPTMTTVNPEPSSGTEKAAATEEPKASEEPTHSEDATKPIVDDAQKPPKPHRPAAGDGAKPQDGALVRPTRRTDAAANTPSSPMSFLGRLLSGGPRPREGNPTN
jgi:hypothetical protein